MYLFLSLKEIDLKMHEINLLFFKEILLFPLGFDIFIIIL